MKYLVFSDMDLKILTIILSLSLIAMSSGEMLSLFGTPISALNWHNIFMMSKFLASTA